MFILNDVDNFEIKQSEKRYYIIQNDQNLFVICDSVS